ncbi:hypothetical protein TRV_06975 [Trichophyton verrucosum HKI 0517]|uniref:Major facilitator superfamily (MFS) profile domain-containing protein n=1 Tax=Trichophyton verrucosum (strain HKI 0517) TaxID=663202 RepID=D4DIG7_TRIVH|nr:uncharacterized protein TRV_06975 [Trichophyton verrucosum HKI 0517]EFE38319.1 hypothetical protein TRV_06975 [Trichophyton verrucosum HKI 0517]
MSNFSSPKARRASSTPHYQTFSTPPPKSAGRPLSAESGSTNPSSSHIAGDRADAPTSTPIPIQQMSVLAFIALCEQTALNSISPYLPAMAASFPEVESHEVGIYVGTIASAFALAQFSTNFFWGWLSDRIGRKPVMLLGTVLTAVCFLAFGFCKTLWQAIVAQLFMGLVNGNQGVVSTCLGEITDRSNQSRAFTYLPVIYGIGGITGPILGGLLASKDPKGQTYPFLAPNLVSAAILIGDFIITSIFLEESVDGAEMLPRIYRKFRDMFTWLWQFHSSSRPTYLRNDIDADYPRRSVRHGVHHYRDSVDSDDDNDDTDIAITPLFPHRSHNEALNRDEIFNRDMILLLLTYLIFSLSNVSFNSLYPIFAQAPPPTGREFNPKEIGMSLAFAGIVTIVFQICVFGRLRDKMGNRWSYRAGLLGFVASFILMPFIGYKDKTSADIAVSKQNVFVAVEVCVVLLIKTVATVGGLTSALLLITNSAPDHSVLGSLNGLAQTLSAAGRAVGPFLSGSLFTLATKVKPKGEALAFGVFGGVAFVGFLLSLGIRSRNLEAEGWGEEDDDCGKSDEEDDV